MSHSILSPNPARRRPCVAPPLPQTSWNMHQTNSASYPPRPEALTRPCANPLSAPTFPIFFSTKTLRRRENATLQPSPLRDSESAASPLPGRRRLHPRASAAGHVCGIPPGAAPSANGHVRGRRSRPPLPPAPSTRFLAAPARRQGVRCCSPIPFPAPRPRDPPAARPRFPSPSRRRSPAVRRIRPGAAPARFRLSRSGCIPAPLAPRNHFFL